MKVTHVKTRIIRTPADNPLVIGIPVGNATREFVTLELGTDAGVEGMGEGHSLQHPGPRGVHSPVRKGSSLFTFRRGRSRRAAWAKPPAV